MKENTRVVSKLSEILTHQRDQLHEGLNNVGTEVLKFLKDRVALVRDTEDRKCVIVYGSKEKPQPNGAARE